MKQPISLRGALPKEASELALVNARAYAARDGELSSSVPEEDDVLDIQERMSRPGVWTKVATIGDKVVGFALGYPKTDEEVPEQVAEIEYLSLLAVDPEYQGHGAASKLLDLVADSARNSGRSNLVLWTTEADNEHARNFYENRGFEVSGEVRETQYGHQIEYQQSL